MIFRSFNAGTSYSQQKLAVSSAVFLESASVIGTEETFEGYKTF